MSSAVFLLNCSNLSAMFQWDDYLYVQEDADLGMQDEPDDQATCGVIYNIGPYGGYMYSEQALKEFEKRTGQPLKENFVTRPSRYDQTMVEIVQELGSKATSRWPTSLKIVYTKPEYVPFIAIKRVLDPGGERPVFRSRIYALNTVHETVQNKNLSPEEKIKRIQDMFESFPLQCLRSDCPTLQLTTSKAQSSTLHPRK